MDNREQLSERLAAHLRNQLTKANLAIYRLHPDTYTSMVRVLGKPEVPLIMSSLSTGLSMANLARKIQQRRILATVGGAAMLGISLYSLIKAGRNYRRLDGMTFRPATEEEGQRIRAAIKRNNSVVGESG